MIELIVLGVYLAGGLATVAYATWVWQLKEGKDVTLAHLIPFFCILLFWPFLLMLVAFEWCAQNGNRIVLIKSKYKNEQSWLD